MEDFDENDEMAAMMGFSSFGGTKKRKFDQTNSPAKDDYSASGANSTELGVRTKTLETDQPTGEYVPSVSAVTKPAAAGLAGFLARGQAMPDRPPKATSLPQADENDESVSASELVSFGGPSVSRSELNALRFGVKDANGDTAYFMPSFVEDPWEKLLPGQT
ncbi:hypothetical protein E8E13_006498 [Curvularia kusanoi]|uniref:U4/U6.U5 small nuclear ribonucleoprotein 27kDa protein domain-containing protein n=1 Tax=Curvularia kusanoi TaxID=90978 RepID=A0A9P4WCV0_CURKU|nr:hypothetical protein E8E13_006498 [Curvularia kusanoi]